MSRSIIFLQVHVSFNINWGDVQTIQTGQVKRAPWQYGPYKVKHLKPFSDTNM